MKKKLTILGMIICLLGLTACGKDQVSVMTEEELAAVDVADTYISQISQIVATEGMVEQYTAYDETLAPVFESWQAGLEELGEMTEISDHTVKFDGKEVIVNTTIVGTKLDPKGEVRTADVELIYGAKDYTIISLSVNVNYTFGELMMNAGLNTILGMGTVFAILILISWIISCFTIINKLENRKSKKEAKEAEKEASVDNTIAQIIENEEMSDDAELVAVISAAIAAYEAENGYVSADGVVIRSIRKVNKGKWQNA